MSTFGVLLGIVLVLMVTAKACGSDPVPYKGVATVAPYSTAEAIETYTPPVPCGDIGFGC